MKTPSDDLFGLIKSLNSNEKRYFKRLSYENKPGNNFLILFRSIETMETYNEILLKKKLNKSGGIKNLKQIKSQLYNKIIITLSTYYNTTSIKRNVQNLIYYSELLIDKLQYKSAMKYLLKAENLAVEHQQYPDLLTINTLKISCARHKTISEGEKAEISNATLAENGCIHSIRNSIEYRNIWLRISNIYSLYADNLSKTHLKKEVHRISNLPLIKTRESPKSVSSKNYYYDIRHFITLLTGKWNDSAFDLQVEFVHYLEEQPELLHARASQYITGISRVITTLNKLKRSEESECFFNKASTFYMSLSPKRKSRSLRFYFVEMILVNYMDSQLLLLNPEKVIYSWEKAKKELQMEKYEGGTGLVVHINLFLSYLYLSKYHEALQHLNLVVNFNKPNRLDIQAEARILILILHYELGNTDVLSNLAGSSKRFLLKNGYFTEFTDIIITFFEKEINKNRRRNSDLFIDLQKKISTLFKNRNEEKKAIENFDYIAWVDSKIMNKPFLDILKAKAKAIRVQ